MLGEFKNWEENEESNLQIFLTEYRLILSIFVSDVEYLDNSTIGKFTITNPEQSNGCYEQSDC